MNNEHFIIEIRPLCKYNSLKFLLQYKTKYRYFTALHNLREVFNYFEINAGEEYEIISKSNHFNLESFIFELQYNCVVRINNQECGSIIFNYKPYFVRRKWRLISLYDVYTKDKDGYVPPKLYNKPSIMVVPQINNTCYVFLNYYPPVIFSFSSLTSTVLRSLFGSSAECYETKGIMDIRNSDKIFIQYNDYQFEVDFNYIWKSS